MRPPRVLFVAYTFPPIGGSGVQRTTKFVKYLPEFGWECSVLTVQGGSVPVWDQSLLEDVPPTTRVVRAKTFEPSYQVKAAAVKAPGGSSISTKAKGVVSRAGRSLLQPDAQVLWFPAACATGRRFLESLPHDVIVATGPPFTCFLVGRWLAKTSGLPLVLDYRDEWSLSNIHYENRRPGAVAARTQRMMEDWVLKGADVILATTRASAASVGAAARAVGSNPREACIYNGYDQHDFPDDASPRPTSQRFRLVYTGTLWSLMSFAPIVRALEDIGDVQPGLLDRLDVVVAGRRTGEQEELLTRLERLGCRLERHDYVDHAGAIDLMRGADALCLLLENSAGADRWVPAKTFEYLASGVPLLAVIPPGELESIVADYPGTHLAASGNPPQLAAILTSMLTAHSLGNWPRRVVANSTRFERSNQAGELALLLSSLNCKATALASAITQGEA